MYEQSAPVKEGEEYVVSINAIGEKGDGIARVKGFVLFVPHVKTGDTVKVRITKVLPKVGFAEVIEHTTLPSPESRFETVSVGELAPQQERESEQYEDTEDFGAELEEK